MKPETRYLYRVYNSDRDLLYVGITFHLGQRMSYHRHSQPWWSEVAEVVWKPYPTDLCTEAERRVIYYEEPKYNVVFNRERP